MERYFISALMIGQIYQAILLAEKNPDSPVPVSVAIPTGGGNLVLTGTIEWDRNKKAPTPTPPAPPTPPVNPAGSPTGTPADPTQVSV